MSSRGRSMSRGAGGRKRGHSRVSSLVSRSRSVRSANSNDGVTRRGWANPQSYSMYYDPFPRVMRAVLRYSDVVLINPVVGFTASHIYRAGSIFDPDYTAAGHQPYGYDTYALIYNHYRVVKSVCKVTNTTGGGNTIMSLSLHDDVGTVSDYDLTREMKPGKFVPLNTTTETKSLSMVYNSVQAFPGQISDTTALMGNNPAEEMYFHISAQGSNKTVDGNGLSVVVTLEYYVEFSELKNLGIS